MDKKKRADLIMKRYWPMMNDEQRKNLFTVAEWLSKYAPQTDYDPAFSYAALYVHTGTEESMPVAGTSTLPFMEYNVERTNKGLRATLATLKAALALMPANEDYTFILQGLASNIQTVYDNFSCARAVAYSCAGKRMPRD